MYAPISLDTITLLERRDSPVPNHPDRLKIVPLSDAIGARIEGVDLSQPVADEIKAVLRKAWQDHLVILFQGQVLTPREYRDAAAIFGTPQEGAMRRYYQEAGLPTQDEVAEVSILSNLGPEGKPVRENDGLGSLEVVWHSDNSYIEKPPAGSALYALEAPANSGRTSFANQYLAYETLPEDLKAAIAGRRAKHDASRNSAGVLRPGIRKPETPEDVPGPFHPLVVVNPETGRRALYLGRRRDLAVAVHRRNRSHRKRSSARPVVGTCDQGGVHLDPFLESGRPAGLEQPLRHAPPHADRRDPAPGDAAHPVPGRRAASRLSAASSSPSGDDMTQQTRKMALGAFLYPTGHHAAAWRHPDAQADAGINFKHYAAVAQAAEAAKFDLLFLADSAGARGKDWSALARFSTHYVAQFEPTTLLGALAAVTERIGLVATASTTYIEPYHLARKFASIDHISGGRAGWNLVTSGNEDEAFNFGYDQHPPHDERYERAAEFMEVVKGLWDSWEDDAFLRDKESGVFFDLDKVYTLDHKGRYFGVRGPLNIPRPPQGYPVLVQAGSSDAGRALAAASAEVVFTAQQTLDSAQEFYRDVKARAVANGRSPEDILILPGIFPVVGRTEAEAREKFEELQNLIHPAVGLSILEHRLGIPLSHLPFDGPLPDDIPITNAPSAARSC